MTIDRRKFLKAAGLTALGVMSKPLALLAQSGDVELVPPDTAHTLSRGLPQDHPLTAKRWAMVIDLKKCANHDNIKDVYEACHREHNVPHFENPKHEIKWIWEEPFEHTFHEQEIQFATEQFEHIELPVMCNHCDNPPCVRVCPTQATWRREKDGIVMMDWHRCIGCRYCIVACPYGSRSFNWRDPRENSDDGRLKVVGREDINRDFPTRTRGVVEKCTFCDERLARGMQPACVEAAKDNALVFGDLEDDDSEVRKLLKERFALRRKPALGTQPEVYYLV